MAINRNFIVDAGLEVKTSATVTTSLQAGSLTVLGLSNQVGAAVFSNTVAITGATTVSNILTMNQSNTTGSANVGSILNVGGNTTIGGFANVAGAFRATGAANVLSTFGIGGAANALSTLGVTGATSLLSTLNVTGNTVLSGTANVAGNVVISGTANVSGAAVFNSAVTIQGNLIVQGTTTTVNTQTLNVADNLITLNSDWVGAPTENAGMEVNRGTSANVALIWNENTDRWEVTNNGTNYGLIHSTLRDVVLGTETSGAYIATATSTTPALTLGGTGGEGATLSGSIRTASTSQDGIVTLTDSISNTSLGVAGSASAVKSAYDNAVSYTNAFASNASNISSGTLATARLATSGVTAGQYGTSSAIPVITVDDRGRVTALSTTSVAGVTGFSFAGANNTLTISTGTGSTFSANVNGLTGTFGINISGTAANSSALNGQSASFYTDIVSRLGYTPVQQGGGTSQLTNKVYIGWNGSQLALQVDSTNFGGTWPININGNAATATSATTAGSATTATSATTAGSATTATTASTANALNTGNSYQGVNFTASGRFLAGNGSASSPSLAFSSDGSQDTGFYWTSDGFINMTNNGVYSGQFGPGGTLNIVGAMTASQFNGSGAGLTGTASSLTAGAANAVAWTNVSGRPTALSAFTNDSGYVTSSGSVSFATTAGTANAVAWTNVSGRPTALSAFTNDSGYVTSSGSVNFATTAGTANAVAWTNVTGRPTNVSSFSNDSGYITTNGRAFPRRSDGTSINFFWEGQSGQPTWLWGGNDGVNFYVYNPSNFSVSYAASAGAVAWTNVSGRPTAVSAFTNDSGYVTSSGSVASATTAGTASNVTISYNNDSNSTFQMLWGSGNAVYGTGGIYCNPSSDIVYASDFFVTSDDTLKNRIGNVPNALAAVNSLNGFRFTWNKKAVELRGYNNETPQVGVSAQEVEAILPEAVHTDKDGYKTVSYDSLVPLLIEAVKELSAKVAELEAR